MRERERELDLTGMLGVEKKNKGERKERERKSDMGVNFSVRLFLSSTS